MENISKFSIRLDQECQKVGKSINQIERELGYPRNSLHNYKGSRLPSGKRLIEIANYFNISPNYLIGTSEIKTDDKLVNYFHKLTLDDKKKLYHICQDWFIDLVTTNK